MIDIIKSWFCMHKYKIIDRIRVEDADYRTKHNRFILQCGKCGRMKKFDTEGFF